MTGSLLIANCWFLVLTALSRGPSLRFRLLLFALFLSLPACLMAQNIPMGSSSYTLNLNGKSCGKISSSITATENGYSLKTAARLQIGSTPFAFSRSGSVDKQLNPQEEILNGSVNGSAVVFGLDASGGKYNIRISANGKQYSNTLASHPHTVFLPDFDPAAAQLIVTETATYQNIWVLIPKKTGLLDSVQVVKHSPGKGTLDGKAISVQHFTVTISGLSSDIFATTTGLFLQQETPEQGFALIRDGFVLTPSSTAPATGSTPSKK